MRARELSPAIFWNSETFLFNWTTHSLNCVFLQLYNSLSFGIYILLYSCERVALWARRHTHRMYTTKTSRNHSWKTKRTHTICDGIRCECAWASVRCVWVCVYSGATMKHVIVLRVYCSAAVDAADANCILHFQSNSSRPLIRASVCIHMPFPWCMSIKTKRTVFAYKHTRLLHRDRERDGDSSPFVRNVRWHQPVQPGEKWKNISPNDKS